MFVYIRNVTIAAIAFYYSVFQMIRNYKKNEKSNEETTSDNLGMHAINDFDTAMRSSMSIESFRDFINIWTDFGKMEEQQARHCKKYFEIYQLITIHNLLQN